MSQSKNMHFLKPLIRTNKNFIYKGKKYPIDFNLIQNHSKDFYTNCDNYANSQDIPLSEELIDISDESIQCFISSCQNERFEINDSNVFALHQLSIRYEIPCLKALTDEYIKENNKTLILQSIQYNYKIQQQQDSYATTNLSLENDERIISREFFKYINDDQLLNLPVPVLYRIINNPELDINQMNETQKNQYIDFLFKCLKKHKKEASVLFLNLDLENQRVDIFSQLVNNYSEIFDFSMINQKFLFKTTTDLLSELSQLKKNYSNSISQVNQLLKQFKEEKQKQQELIDSFKQFANDQLKEENEKLKNSFNELKNQIENEKNNIER